MTNGAQAAQPVVRRDVQLLAARRYAHYPPWGRAGAPSICEVFASADPTARTLLVVTGGGAHAAQMRVAAHKQSGNTAGDRLASHEVGGLHTPMRRGRSSGRHPAQTGYCTISRLVL